MLRSNVCNLLKRLSFDTWMRIGFVRSTTGLKISETTITENILFKLSLCRSRNIRIFEAIDEATNGNDIELVVQTYRGYIILPTQAKIIHKIDQKYKEINHKIHSTGRFQIDNLIDYAYRLGGVPMYLFYNYIPGRPPGWRHYGCTMMDANYIKTNFSPARRTPTLSRWKIPKFDDFYPAPAIPWHILLCDLLGNPVVTTEEQRSYIDRLFYESDIRFYTLDELADTIRWVELPRDSEVTSMGNPTVIDNYSNGFNPRFRIILSSEEQ